MYAEQWRFGGHEGTRSMEETSVNQQPMAKEELCRRFYMNELRYREIRKEKIFQTFADFFHFSSDPMNLIAVDKLECLLQFQPERHFVDEIIDDVIECREVAVESQFSDYNFNFEYNSTKKRKESLPCERRKEEDEDDDDDDNLEDMDLKEFEIHELNREMTGKMAHDDFYFSDECRTVFNRRWDGNWREEMKSKGKRTGIYFSEEKKIDGNLVNNDEMIGIHKRGLETTENDDVIIDECEERLNDAFIETLTFPNVNDELYENLSTILHKCSSINQKDNDEETEDEDNENEFVRDMERQKKKKMKVKEMKGRFGRRSDMRHINHILMNDIDEFIHLFQEKCELIDHEQFERLKVNELRRLISIIFLKTIKISSASKQFTSFMLNNDQFNCDNGEKNIIDISQLTEMNNCRIISFNTRDELFKRISSPFILLRDKTSELTVKFLHSLKHWIIVLQEQQEGLESSCHSKEEFENLMELKKSLRSIIELMTDSIELSENMVNNRRRHKLNSELLLNDVETKKRKENKLNNYWKDLKEIDDKQIHFLTILEKLRNYKKISHLCPKHSEMVIKSVFLCNSIVYPTHFTNNKFNVDWSSFDWFYQQESSSPYLPSSISLSLIDEFLLETIEQFVLEKKPVKKNSLLFSQDITMETNCSPLFPNRKRSLSLLNGQQQVYQGNNVELKNENEQILMEEQKYFLDGTFRQCRESGISPMDYDHYGYFAHYYRQQLSKSLQYFHKRSNERSYNYDYYGKIMKCENESINISSPSSYNNVMENVIVDPFSKMTENDGTDISMEMNVDAIENVSIDDNITTNGISEELTNHRSNCLRRSRDYYHHHHHHYWNGNVLGNGEDGIETENQRMRNRQRKEKDLKIYWEKRKMKINQQKKLIDDERAIMEIIRKISNTIFHLPRIDIRNPNFCAMITELCCRNSELSVLRDESYPLVRPENIIMKRTSENEFRQAKLIPKVLSSILRLFAAVYTYEMCGKKENKKKSRQASSQTFNGNNRHLPSPVTVPTSFLHVTTQNLSKPPTVMSPIKSTINMINTTIVESGRSGENDIGEININLPPNNLGMSTNVIVAPNKIGTSITSEMKTMKTTTKRSKSHSKDLKKSKTITQKNQKNYSLNEERLCDINSSIVSSSGLNFYFRSHKSIDSSDGMIMENPLISNKDMGGKCFSRNNSLATLTSNAGFMVQSSTTIQTVCPTSIVVYNDITPFISTTTFSPSNSFHPYQPIVTCQYGTCHLNSEGFIDPNFPYYSTQPPLPPPPPPPPPPQSPLNSSSIRYNTNINKRLGLGKAVSPYTISCGVDGNIVPHHSPKLTPKYHMPPSPLIPISTNSIFPNIIPLNFTGSTVTPTIIPITDTTIAYPISYNPVGQMTIAPSIAHQGTSKNFMKNRYYDQVATSYHYQDNLGSGIYNGYHRTHSWNQSTTNNVPISIFPNFQYTTSVTLSPSTNGHVKISTGSRMRQTSINTATNILDNSTSITNNKRFESYNMGSDKRQKKSITTKSRKREVNYEGNIVLPSNHHRKKMENFPPIRNYPSTTGLIMEPTEPKHRRINDDYSGRMEISSLTPNKRQHLTFTGSPASSSDNRRRSKSQNINNNNNNNSFPIDKNMSNADETTEIISSNDPNCLPKQTTVPPYPASINLTIPTTHLRTPSSNYNYLSTTSLSAIGPTKSPSTSTLIIPTGILHTKLPYNGRNGKNQKLVNTRQSSIDANKYGKSGKPINNYIISSIAPITVKPSSTSLDGGNSMSTFQIGNGNVDRKTKIISSPIQIVPIQTTNPILRTTTTTTTTTTLFIGTNVIGQNTTSNLINKTKKYNSPSSNVIMSSSVISDPDIYHHNKNKNNKNGSYLIKSSLSQTNNLREMRLKRNDRPFNPQLTINSSYQSTSSNTLTITSSIDLSISTSSFSSSSSSSITSFSTTSLSTGE
ncbi:hypothetical protein SNEBB_005157 [Seison nebaliae]|nr:hypothetical protein SNEBB_005157 [Seison nebaliae]